jgi:hypothetical protein
VCNRGEEGIGEWRAYTGVINYVFDQIPNLQKALPPPNKNLGGEEASDR